MTIDIAITIFVTELNATRASESTDTEEDVLYQKDVSFSAELEVAPSSRVRNNLSERHIEQKPQRLTTSLPEVKLNYTYTAERSKEVDGLKSLIEDGVSKVDLNIIADDKDGAMEAGELKVTTLGPSLEQKVNDELHTDATPTNVYARTMISVNYILCKKNNE